MFGFVSQTEQPRVTFLIDDNDYCRSAKVLTPDRRHLIADTGGNIISASVAWQHREIS
jgi:hypothetical protein